MRCRGKNTIKHSKSIIALCSLLAAIFCLAIIPMSAMAHPPGSVKLSYNLSAQTLTVTIVHKTSAPNSHYINKVALNQNGKPAGINTYQNQPDQSEFSYTYSLPAKIGDTVEVTVTCNIYGSKTEKLIVNKELA